ncbi:MAG: hypothetical protein LQ348_006680 [Seirophora lacunosa]|nr:MAG: hypothetical protein LQ348_006680 [Seirophora lacunosa]
MANEHAPTARTREKPSGDEEATADLKLGEFQTVPALTLSEARVLINAVIDNRRSLRKVEATENLTKTQDYLEVFARFKQKENIEAVDRMLSAKPEFELFERSQLGTKKPLAIITHDGSLCCETAEEAKTLIPSLTKKITDQDLQELLDDITKLRQFVE